MRHREKLKIATSRLLHRPPLDKLADRVVHLVGPPRLDQLYARSALMTDSPVEVVAALGESTDYTDEFDALNQRITAAPAAANYPDHYTIEDATARLLYTLVRQVKPELVVEMGVADGRSTQVMLGALDANESGRLVSVDIKDDVGGGAAGHPRWSLRVHSPQDSVGQLRALLAEIGPPDLFFHDALHTYYAQYAEYLAAIDAMLPGSVFVSDDVDSSWAFLDLATTLGQEPLILTDRRKAAGILIRP